MRTSPKKIKVMRKHEIRNGKRKKGKKRKDEVRQTSISLQFQFSSMAWIKSVIFTSACPSFKLVFRRFNGH